MIDHVLAYTLPAAYSLLPPAMYSTEATALLLTIGLNESRFVHRRQIHGPARSFWQFELGGMRGVLNHPQSQRPILDAIRSLAYQPDEDGEVFLALEHNDTLAACFARCLLWTLPDALPGQHQPDAAWAQYRAAWRPGKPHFETWHGHYALAWNAVMDGWPKPPGEGVPV